MAKFYKIFKEDLTSKFQIVFNNITEGDSPPKTWQQALITIIPKEESSCPSVKDFRPISLLNVDDKIFTKILAERLKKILKEIIGTDQTGVLPRRHLRDNLRTVLNIIEYGDKSPMKKLGFFFLNAEKVFDNLNW